MNLHVAWRALLVLLLDALLLLLLSELLPGFVLDGPGAALSAAVDQSFNAISIDSTSASPMLRTTLRPGVSSCKPGRRRSRFRVPGTRVLVLVRLSCPLLESLASAEAMVL